MIKKFLFSNKVARFIILTSLLLMLVVVLQLFSGTALAQPTVDHADRVGAGTEAAEEQVDRDQPTPFRLDHPVRFRFHGLPHSVSVHLGAR